MKNKKILLLSSILTCTFSHADPLLENGNFSKPLAPWKVISKKDAPATEKSAENGELTIKAADASDKNGTRQLVQIVALEAGNTYSLSFDVKGTLEGESEMVVVLVSAPGKYAYFRKVPITADWQTQKLRVIPKEFQEGSELKLKFLMGKLKGDIVFRNVSLEAKGAKAPKEPKEQS